MLPAVPFFPLASALFSILAAINVETLQSFLCLPSRLSIPAGRLDYVLENQMDNPHFKTA